ncbi:MAG: protease complex subunit PrcB family protein [Gemmatimonadales bacterium]|nr:MAG: protease complex subunit PrcB family protein [Gemmatimonadales bacterium]
MSTRTVALVVAAALASSAFACTQGGVVGIPDAATQLSGQQVQTVLQTGNSGLDQRSRTVLRSQAEWADAWTRAHALLIPAPAVPPLDFDARIVVLAAMGQRASGGYAIEISGVHQDGDDLYVRVREVRPGPGCGMTMALTAPVHAVSVPRVAGTVRFVETEVTRDC